MPPLPQLRPSTKPPAGGATTWRCVVAVALVGALVLAGCGDDGAPDDPGAATPPAGTGTGSESASAAPSAGSTSTAPGASAPSEDPAGQDSVGSATEVTTRWEFAEALESPDGAWAAPYGVDVAADGTVWVADTGNHRVVGLHPDGTSTVIGEQGDADGQFTTLGFGSLAVAEDGTLHVVDNGNHRIQSFAPDGTFLRAFGSEGDGDGQFLRAIGIAVGPDGSIHVTDDERPEVQVFSAEGTYERSYGDAGDGPGGFAHPTGIDVAAEGTAWVTDFELQRLQAFAPDGTFLADYASPGAAGTSAVLEGVQVTPDGGVLVTSYGGGEVLAVPGPGAAADADWPVVAGASGSGDGQFRAPVDLAVAPDGSLVVTDQTTNTVQRFRPVS